jgi:hypothetical protein
MHSTELKTLHAFWKINSKKSVGLERGEENVD